MSRHIFKILLAAAALALAPTPALAQGALVSHFSDCTAQGSFFANGPNGGVLVGDWQHNRGDIRRTGPDGTGWVSLADGAANLLVIDGLTGDVSVGTGSFSLDAGANLDPDPCGGWAFDGSFAQLHTTGEMTNLTTGQTYLLVIEAVVRNGVFLNFKVMQL